MRFLYVVLKEGVYRHDIVGVYTKYLAAEVRACDCIKAEPDDYHTFCVYKCPQNTPIGDGRRVFEVRRDGLEVTERRYT